MNAVSRGPKKNKFNLGGDRAKAMWKLKIKNGRKPSKSEAGGHPAGRDLAKKVRSDQKLWFRCTNRCVFI